MPSTDRPTRWSRSIASSPRRSPTTPSASSCSAGCIRRSASPTPRNAALERARDLGFGSRVDRPLGAVYVALKQPEQGAAILQRYLAANPSDAWAHLQLGKAFADQGKADQAVREYQRAARLDGNLDEAHRLLGHVARDARAIRGRASTSSRSPRSSAWRSGAGLQPLRPCQAAARRGQPAARRRSTPRSRSSSPSCASGRASAPQPPRRRSLGSGSLTPWRARAAGTGGSRSRDSRCSSARATPRTIG